MYIGVCAAASQIQGLDLLNLRFLEATVSAHLVPEKDEDVFARVLAESRLCRAPVTALNCFLPAAMKIVGPDVDDAAVDAYVLNVLVRAERAAVQRIAVGSGGSRRLPEGWDAQRGFEQLAIFLSRIAPWAHQRQLTLCIEPLNARECNLINTLDEGARLVRAVNHPGVRLLADLYHMARQGEGPEALRAAEGLLAHAHVAEREHRTPPGVAGDDFRPYLRVMREIGYAGDISIEADWRDFRSQAGPAVDELRRQIDSVM